MQKQNGDFPAPSLDNMKFIYTTIGKLTIRKLKKEIAASGLKLVSFENYTGSTLKKFLMKIPFMEEYFAGNIRVHLQKSQA
jgi:hypothetical protein